MDFLHVELKKVNQTWWQVDEEGCFYELLPDSSNDDDDDDDDVQERSEYLRKGECDAGFRCQLQCPQLPGVLACYGSCMCRRSKDGSACDIYCSTLQCSDVCWCNKIGTGGRRKEENVKNFQREEL
jgi:hypothetical protein